MGVDVSTDLSVAPGHKQSYVHIFRLVEGLAPRPSLLCTSVSATYPFCRWGATVVPFVARPSSARGSLMYLLAQF